jgi:hypothetical protein
LESFFDPADQAGLWISSGGEAKLGEVLAGLSPKGSVNKPAGIRSLVYGIGKGKVGIEGLRV